MLLMSSTLSAQDNCGDKYREQYLTGNVFYPYFLNYDGSPFYTDEWTTGSIKILSGDVYSDLKIRYDLNKDDIIYYNESIKKWILVDREIINEVWIKNPATGQDFNLVHNYSIDTAANDKFFFVLIEGSVPLYMKKVKLIDEYHSNYQAGCMLGKFYEKTRFYFVLNNKFYRVPLRKKKFLAYFPEQADMLKKYINKNKYSLRSPDDLISVFKEINRIE